MDFVKKLTILKKYLNINFKCTKIYHTPPLLVKITKLCSEKIPKIFQ